MSDKKYKWASPQEWLDEKLNDAQQPNTLRIYARTLATAMDNDSLQDLFQDEMDEDGYFSPLCEECNEPIDISEETSNYCYSHAETCSKHPDKIEEKLQAEEAQ